MKTGFEDIEMARKFGFPYVVPHTPRPFDTTTLNYNWQVWNTKAFSIYTTTTDQIDKASARQAVEAILNFLKKEGIIDYHGFGGIVVDEIYAPVEGTILFSHAEPKAYQNTAVYKIVPEGEVW